MAGTGRTPKDADQRARRNATVAMTRLPASGRTGRAPAWPLGADVGLETKVVALEADLRSVDVELDQCTVSRDKAALRRKRQRIDSQLRETKAMKLLLARNEKKLWADLWKLPQATQWEKRAWYREVALFVRHQLKAEAGSLDDSKEARQREDRLGLNDQSMLRLRWAIVDDAEQQTGPAPKSRRNSSKYRNLKVVS